MIVRVEDPEKVEFEAKISEKDRDPGEVVAADLAHFLFEHPQEWQHSFVLARQLKRFGGVAEDFEETVRMFCEQTGHAFEDFYPNFVADWDKVKFADSGHDTFAVAAQLAIDEPIPLPNNLALTKAAAKIYSLSYHLAVHTSPFPFILPQSRVAEVMGIKKSTVSKILTWMKAKGLIQCVDPNYVFGKGKGMNKAMKYRILQ